VVAHILEERSAFYTKDGGGTYLLNVGNHFQDFLTSKYIFKKLFRLTNYQFYGVVLPH
jgi:hypothetical protein